MSDAWQARASDDTLNQRMLALLERTYTVTDKPDGMTEITIRGHECSDSLERSMEASALIHEARRRLA